MWQWEGEWLGGASDLSQLSVIGVTSGLDELITTENKMYICILYVLYLYTVDFADR